MKKGFTLIELLAVIVILAIIALIATPIILGIIEDARKGSIESSANGYIDAVEYKIAREEIKGTETSSGVYDVTSLDIDLDGSKPTSGVVSIEKGKITEANLCIDGYNVEYKNNKPKVLGICGYREKLLYGADPVLKDELVPVVIADNGIVTKADTTKEWYNYEDKKWANAVILFGEDKYKAGDRVDESDIKEYYVWIPKYAYKLWNVNSDNTENVEKPIEIEFGLKAKTTGENNGDMYVHPAFTNFDTKGIWVGKFETSYNEETYINKDTFLKVNSNYTAATNSEEIIIKPNIRSLTNKRVSEFHTLIYNSHRGLNSHVMTNMEWGAVGYLTYSIFGRCDGDTCIEVTNNNVNTGYYPQKNTLFENQWQYGATITGCAANEISENWKTNLQSCINTYESEKGVLASTTGNITGIYDMSGGNWEYVMGVLVQPDETMFSGRNAWYNSLFKGIYGCPECDGNTSGLIENTTGLDIPDSKYYNTYINTNNLSSDIWYNYSEGKLGDATKEIANTKISYPNIDKGNWYNDYAYFITPQNPWFSRGSSWGDCQGVGIFNFSRYHGYNYPSFTARAVLAF